MDQETEKLAAYVRQIWKAEDTRQHCISLRHFFGRDELNGLKISVGNNKAVWVADVAKLHSAVIGLFMYRRGTSVMQVFSLPEILQKVEQIRPQFERFKPDKIELLEKQMASLRSEIAALKAAKAEAEGERDG